MKKKFIKSQVGRKLLTEKQKAKSKAKVDPIFSICELAVNMGPMTNEEMDKLIYEHGHVS